MTTRASARALLLALVVAGAAYADAIDDCETNCGGRDKVLSASTLGDCNCKPDVDPLVRENCWGDPTCGKTCSDGSKPECKSMKGHAVEGIITCHCETGVIQ